MTPFETQIVFWTTALGESATAIGLFVIVVQFYYSLRQSNTAFENDMTQEYRSILQKISYRAFFKNELINEDELEEVRNNIYNYIDLCNEQVFLAMQGKVSRSTWNLWRLGIRTNLNRPVFKIMWEDLKCKDPESFDELKVAEKLDFAQNIRPYWFFNNIVFRNLCHRWNGVNDSLYTVSRSRNNKTDESNKASKLSVTHVDSLSENLPC